MKEFPSLLEAGLFFADSLMLEVEEQTATMEKVARVIEKEAKSLFGEYQPETPPFVGWAELADSTKEDRVNKGFSENDPLLRTGETRDSIEHRSDRESAVVGSDSDILVYLELGTDRMPPRSTLGIAAINKSEEVVEIVGKGVVMALVGEKVFGGSIDL